MKVYKLTLYGPGGSCIFLNPEDIENDLEYMNENAERDLQPDEYEPFSIPECIEAIKALGVGETWEHQEGKVECLEMSQDEIDALPDFEGW